MSTPAFNLDQASADFKAEVAEIEYDFMSSTNCNHVKQYAMQYAPHVDGCVVSLWDAWNRFLRELVMLSARGVSTGSSGRRYAPKVHLSESQVLNFLRRSKLKLKLIDGEPNWYNVNHLTTVINALGLSNSAQIVAAVGATSVHLGSTGSIASPVEEIRLIRNFIAHKTKPNLAKVQVLVGKNPGNHLHQYLWAKTSGGVERFSLWVTALSALAEAACF
ncbi:hypothetical protein [Amycolatopsis sp. ATCC 39116]|uniref:hypothetical protein n=1 Tax=Amycolatopsis sp. (strain ATCC 39116 / 75iv2) TaxID=385957 RepID=UPI0012FBF987|nr:hypothetical protein [Amycolatopsis sp. ATCC 39116]